MRPPINFCLQPGAPLSVPAEDDTLNIASLFNALYVEQSTRDEAASRARRVVEQRKPVEVTVATSRANYNRLFDTWITTEISYRQAAQAYVDEALRCQKRIEELLATIESWAARERVAQITGEIAA